MGQQIITGVGGQQDAILLEMMEIWRCQELGNAQEKDSFVLGKV